MFFFWALTGITDTIKAREAISFAPRFDFMAVFNSDLSRQSDYV